MDKGLSVLSGLALLALVKRNGVGSLTTSKTSKKTDKRYGYRLVTSIYPSHNEREKIVFYERKSPEYPITLSVPKGLSVVDKEIDIDVTNMYIHKIEKEYDDEYTSWNNRFYFIVEFYSNSVVLPLKSVGEEVRDGILYEEYGYDWIEREIRDLFIRYFSIGVGPMMPNPEMKDWEMQRWEYAKDKAKKDPRWDQELQDKYDALFWDQETFFTLDTSHNDDIVKEYEEQFEQLYGNDRPRQQVIAKEYSPIGLSSIMHLLTDRSLLSRRGQVMFAPTVIKITSKVDLTSNNDLITIYPFTTQTKSKLRKR